MRLGLWTLRALLFGLLACGTTETPVEDSTNRSPRRDGGAPSEDDDADDDDGVDGQTVTRRDAGTRPVGLAPPGCGQASFRTQPLVPDMLIVLDRSESMLSGNGVNRWIPSTAAVKTLTNTFQERVAFGLMLFPHSSADCAPGQVVVPVAQRSASQIAQVLDRSTPTGGTPTGDSLYVALETFRRSAAGPDQVQPPRYVLLVTDGQPTCPAARGNSSGITPPELAELMADKKLTIDAIDALAAEDIKTFVVGFDAELEPPLAAALTEFARHGKTERYYPVQDQRTLQQAFDTISANIVSCTFAIDRRVDDPAYLRVQIDDELLRPNDPNGFRVDGNRVTLEGDACETLQERASHQVTINLDCTPVI